MRMYTKLPVSTSGARTDSTETAAAVDPLRAQQTSKWKFRAGMVIIVFIAAAAYVKFVSPYNQPKVRGSDDDDFSGSDELKQALANNQSNPLRTLCPQWTSKFADKYQHECGYWLNRFAQWEESVTRSSKEVAYFCESDEVCRGWGDRLGGILNAFMKALHSNMRFEIGHEGLAELFHPCLLQKSRFTNWASSSRSFRPRTDSCVVSTGRQCNGWLSMTCDGSSIVTKNTDRTCLAGSDCNHLLEAYPDRLSAANMVGCTMRAILEPQDKFFTQMTFPFHYGKGKKKRMSLYEIQQFMSDFYVISIHFRLGDAYGFFHYNSKEIDLNQEKYSRPFRCAQTIESFLSGGKPLEDGQEMMINGKPVRWFLATDTLRVKQLAVHMYGDKLLTLDITPEHVAVSPGAGTDKTLVRTLAEWYVLGLGDELVLNKIGTTPGDFYHGRISAFPKTSWVYQLKHMVWEAGRCVRFSLPLEGIWDDLQTKSCKDGPFYNKKLSGITQDHLKVLEDNNLTFPLAYVVNGQIVSSSEKMTEEPSEDEEEDAAAKGSP